MKCDLNELLELYELEKMPQPATLKSYKYVIKVFVKDTAFLDLQEADLKRILLWRVDVVSRASEATWNTYLRQLRALGNFAVKKGFLGSNVFKEVSFLKQKKKKKKTVDQSTLTYAIQVLEDNPSRYEPAWFWLVILSTLYYTGMRRRQLAGLRWEDLDFKTNTILLRAETSKNTREWVIPMFQAEAGLRELRRNTQLRLKGAVLDSQVFNVCLFTDRFESEELTLDQVSAFFRKLNADIPTRMRISAHRLRHTFGTETAKAGDIKTVQDMMGHSDIRTTCEYIHPDLEQMSAVGGNMPVLGIVRTA